MKLVKSKKQREENAKKNIVFSMNIGIIASVIVCVTVVKDLLSLIFVNLEGYINFFSGIFVLIVALCFLNKSIIEKVPNKKNLRDAIDFCTAMSIVVFGIENIVLGSGDFSSCVDIVLAMILLLFVIIVSIIIFVWTLCFRKDRKYNVD